MIDVSRIVAMNPAPLRGGVLSGERVNYFEMNYTVKIRRDKCSGIWLQADDCLVSPG